MEGQGNGNKRLNVGSGKSEEDTSRWLAPADRMESQDETRELKKKSHI